MICPNCGEEIEEELAMEGICGCCGKEFDPEELENEDDSEEDEDASHQDSTKEDEDKEEAEPKDE